MTITSLPFLGFNILAVLLFLIFPVKYRWISLLISSIAFYWIALSSKPIIVFIFITSLTTWLAARKMEEMKTALDEELKAPGLDKAAKKQLKANAQAKRKTVLMAALVGNIGILVVLKLFNYFADAFAMLAGIFMGTGGASAVRLIMPLGISYYTFATIGYLLDIYWKRYEAEQNYARFLLFAIYYPHIMQGPISRYPKLGAELKKPELRLRWNNFVVGMESIVLGCFKKLVIADRAGIFVSETLKASGMKGGVYLLALVLDAIQIYADFSGYMDIVSGVSKLFDVELEQNFNHPFLAKSVPEFWRRWHMSLGSWFKDYVYYPLTMSRTVKDLNKKAKNLKSPHLKTVIAVIIPVMVTWLLTGLWHGTGKGYVAWGIYYGTLITISVTFEADVQNILKKLQVNTECFSYRLFQTIKIFCIFMGGRFLGTPMGMAHRLEIFRSIRHPIELDLLQYGLTQSDFLVLLMGVIVLIAIAAIEVKENIFSWLNRQNKIFCAIVLYIFMFAVLLLGIYGTTYDSSNFMYQQF